MPISFLSYTEILFSVIRSQLFSRILRNNAFGGDTQSDGLQRAALTVVDCLYIRMYTYIDFFSNHLGDIGGCANQPCRQLLQGNLALRKQDIQSFFLRGELENEFNSEGFSALA